MMMLRRRSLIRTGLAAAGLLAARECLASQRLILLGNGKYKFKNSQAAAVAAAFTNPPTNARALLIDNLVGSLLTAGVWSQLDLLYIIAAADSQAASINWVSPSNFGLIAVNSPTFAANQGYTGNGSNSRLRTQYTPSVNGSNYTQNSASVWTWSRTNVANNGADAGSLGTNNVFVSPKDVSNNFNVQINDATTSSKSNASSVGFFGAQRTNSTTKNKWINGVIFDTTTVTSTGLPSQEQWVCGADSTSFSIRQIAVAAWGASLSGNELAFYNAITTYLQAVGAA